MTEILKDYDLDFYFEDGTNRDCIEDVVKVVLNERYRGATNIEIDEMGGTIYLAYFEALGRRLPKSVLDLPPSEQLERELALFHLISSDY